MLQNNGFEPVITTRRESISAVRLVMASCKQGLIGAILFGVSLIATTAWAGDTVWLDCWTDDIIEPLGQIDPVFSSATDVLDLRIKIREEHMATIGMCGPPFNVQYTDVVFDWRIYSREQPELIPGNFPTKIVRYSSYYSVDGYACAMTGDLAIKIVDEPGLPDSVRRQCGGNNHQYTIKLSADDNPLSGGSLAEVEPAPAPGKDTATLRATVYNSSNQPVPGISVTLLAEVVAESGGHSHHDDDRPIGDLGGTPPLEHLLEKQTTGPDGAVHFTFKAPKVAGDHTITANCDDVSCGSDTGKVWVGIKGLVDIPSSGFWNFIGKTDIHPANHFLSGDAFGKLMDLGQLYKQVYFPFAKPLQLNDASLERGGVFDIDFIPYTDKNGVLHSRTSGSKPGVFWTPPHHEHLRGGEIDIQANGAAMAIPQGYFKDFERLMTKLRMTWNPEYLNESGGHYHVRLLGVAQ